MSLRILLSAISLSGIPLFAGASAALAEELTLDWILDPANIGALSTPRHIWLPGETLLLEDRRRPEAERVLERLDPRTLERRAEPRAQAILDCWKEIAGPERAPKRLGIPSDVSSKGALLYENGGDLFVAFLESAGGGGADDGAGHPAAGAAAKPVARDSPSSLLRRLTNTEAPEDAPRFSPDGRLVSYVRDNDLHLADVATGRERRLTRDGTPSRRNGTLSWVYWEEILNRRDEGYRWSPDSSRILFLQTDESPVAGFPLLDPGPPTPRIRWQRYPKAGSANPAARAGIVGVGENAGEDPVWVDLGPAPPEYIARIAWLPDSSSAAVVTLNRAQNRIELRIACARTGKTRTVLEESSATWINLHDDFHLLPDGDRFIWLSERGGFRDLYLHRLDGGPAVSLVSGPFGVQSGHGGREPWAGSIAWIDPAEARIIFHAARTSSLETQVYSVGLDGRGLDRISEGDGTHAVSFSPEGRFFVDEHSRAGTPPRLTLHRADGTLIHVIAPSATETLARFRLEPPELFDVTARDGTRLPARLLRPRRREGSEPETEGERRHPAIVHVYGGPGSPIIADDWEGFLGLWAQLLASRGYAVFSVDPRSASDRGKALEETARRRFYGEGELDDILAGVGHLKSLPFVDPERVGIWGWSGGGTTALQALTRSKEFRAGVAVAGVTDWLYYDTVYTERYMGRPEENPEGYRTSSPVTHAGDLHGRLLLVHGGGDDNVHAQNALRLADALISAGKQFDLMIYPRRDHGIGDSAARRHLFRLMLDFWERELGK